VANRKYPHTDLICSLAVSPLTILLFQAQITKLLHKASQLMAYPQTALAWQSG